MLWSDASHVGTIAKFWFLRLPTRYISEIIVLGPYFGCWGSLLGPYFTKNGSLLGPYFKAWGSLLVWVAVLFGQCPKDIDFFLWDVPLQGYKGFKVTQGYIHPNNLPYLAISGAHCSPKFTKRSQVFSALILAASSLRTTTHIHATPVHIQNQAAKSQSAEYQIRESICVSTYLNILKATPRPGHSSLTQSD